jgi:hypothetical protein
MLTTCIYTVLMRFIHINLSYDILILRNRIRPKRPGSGSAAPQETTIATFYSIIITIATVQN